MHDFKVGDLVEVVAAEMSGGHYKNGEVFTIAKVQDDGDMDMVEMTGMFLHPREVRLHTQAPDVITIDRADLPEVVDGNGGWRVGGFSYASDLTASQRREHAIRLLALAEFLEARERAAELAATVEKVAKIKLDQRRNELALEFDGDDYDATYFSTQRAIDRIIELEDARG